MGGWCRHWRNGKREGGTLKKRRRMGTRGIREEGRCRGEIRRFLLFLLRRQLLHYRFLSVPQIEERKSRREKNKSGKRLVIGRLESQGRKRFGESKVFACWWEEEEVQRTEDKSSLSRHAGCALFMPGEKRRQQQKRNPLHLTNQPGFSPRHPTTSSHIQAKKKSPAADFPLSTHFLRLLSSTLTSTQTSNIRFSLWICHRIKRERKTWLERERQGGKHYRGEKRELTLSPPLLSLLNRVWSNEKGR